MSEPNVQEMKLPPGFDLQDPMSYDEVVEELQAEIGRLTVQLRVANRQSQKNLAKWARENEDKDAIITALSARLAAYEPVEEASLESVADAVPDSDVEPTGDIPSEQVLAHHGDEPGPAVEPLPAKPKGRR